MNFQQIANMHLSQNKAITNRSIEHLAADIKAIQCLAQAAVNVELFTIPLYMTTLYSIEGMHSITEKPPKEGDKTLYYGRRWPGIKPSPKPVTSNEKAANIYFSVFIQEMLHLQMAANIFNALGNNYALRVLWGPGQKYLIRETLHPTFTSSALVTNNNGWHCYGPEKTHIPHILDITDLSEESGYSDIKVNLGALDENSIKLALLIEEPSDVLSSRIKESARDNYIATMPGGVLENVPFKNWTKKSVESDLPAFGTIATMYECLAAYLNISYQVFPNTDSTILSALQLNQEELTEPLSVNLFDIVFNRQSIQRDLFNTEEEGHPMAEFPRMKTVIDAKNSKEAKQQIFQLMNAITDQGEGATMNIQPTSSYNMAHSEVEGAVEQNYQPSMDALKADYIQYDENGDPLPISGSAEARGTNGDVDHYERFQEVKELIDNGEITTWISWHELDQHWRADDLQTSKYAENPHKDKLPSAESVASALNRLNLSKDREDNFKMMSHVAAGAIAGVTTVLNDYWKNDDQSFPFPSMSGSGDRLSICWAVFGQAPDLSLGEYERISESSRDYLYHACQGMALQPNPKNPDDPSVCASKQVFHTCRGSNNCKAEGGCGFVQKTSGGEAGCRGVSDSASKKGSPQEGCEESVLYSPPADNACGGLGGCAVPISASQLFPESGSMPIYRLQAGQKPEKVPDECIEFSAGDAVYDIAWDAYTKALKAESKTPEQKPEPSDLRLAFPPST